MDLPTDTSRALKYAQPRGVGSCESEVEVATFFPEDHHHQFSQANFDHNAKQKEFKGFFSGCITNSESHRFCLDQKSARSLCATQRHIRTDPRIKRSMTLHPIDLPSITESEGPLDTEHDEDESRTAAVQQGTDPLETEPQGDTSPLETGEISMLREMFKVRAKYFVLI
ncbi:hypothetical protein N7493_009001 [Penicillium malachiteum]|uniref:Uncharacterized protein n=1 Tax=Penicillium malachiteum TaxID=1324776 RepID=A0AAD6MT08_9EURO|nr:hypothetical protein N7493_009001 [Penicillium malachiteum]